MGRSMLIVVLLMSTLYAGIMVTLQRHMFSVPDIISDNMMVKQAESVSDYALRTAVRNSVSLGMQASPDSVLHWNTVYNNFNVFDSRIDSIRYSFVETASRYRAQTYVTSRLAGRSVQYRAEIAFDFPVIEAVGNPNCFYLRMNQPQFNPAEHWNQVLDSSPNHNDGLFYGDIDTRPMGQGVDGWKCASYGIGGGYITHPGNASMEVNSNFSLVTFAKIREDHPAATIIWLASDPNDSNSAYTDSLGYHPGQNLRLKPTAGIWYENGYVYFSSVNTVYNQITISVPFTPAGKWPHNKDQWIFFGLTYNRGILKAYINGVLVGTNFSGWPFSAITNTYGYSIGRRDIRKDSGLATGWYKYMYGLLDELGLYNRTLSDAEMAGWYNQVISPANIHYIRD